ncbi:MAG: hypothetical protein ABL899_01115 [Nitrospira sp.]
MKSQNPTLEDFNKFFGAFSLHLTEAVSGGPNGENRIKGFAQTGQMRDVRNMAEEALRILTSVGIAQAMERVREARRLLTNTEKAYAIGAVEHVFLLDIKRLGKLDANLNEEVGKAFKAYVDVTEQLKKTIGVDASRLMPEVSKLYWELHDTLVRVSLEQSRRCSAVEQAKRGAGRLRAQQTLAEIAAKKNGRKERKREQVEAVKLDLAGQLASIFGSKPAGKSDDGVTVH